MLKHTRHRLGIAHWIHRLSGLALVLFLPLHFTLLAQSLRGAAEMNVFLDWTSQPIFKLAEFGLVFLLAVHMFGGIRLLVLEWIAPSSERWTDLHKTLAAVAVAMGFGVALLFLLRAI